LDEEKEENLKEETLADKKYIPAVDTNL